MKVPGTSFWECQAPFICNSIKKLRHSIKNFGNSINKNRYSIKNHDNSIKTHAMALILFFGKIVIDILQGRVLDE
ncbi:hypothetical protein GCM10011351_25160 [Paraliobacillus quinghaiensis]|uniref:Uncharacterized protein n=1 Tax=Paraliobacillus quinghaiensis TaxID=470815 RepID=A0A917TTV8_9BACI|nr:hypothetical protein GCM10011351_25160 [Paraliobacillus quinghaiensis]